MSDRIHITLEGDRGTSLDDTSETEMMKASDLIHIITEGDRGTSLDDTSETDLLTASDPVPHLILTNPTKRNRVAPTQS